ncbi:piggyBac transposable element-derived protein 4-like [Dermacentor albipictus]|uniref:piggyBac transposable element-derived protein 4-like n=1 Tax=Dermacentor albipictus TaxID=60249 RepID=UPI0031FCF944
MAASTSRQAKRKATYTKKKTKRRKRSLDLCDNIVENEEETPGTWGCDEPDHVLQVPKTWDPEMSQKLPSKPIEAFSLYFDDEVMQLLVEETNRFAEQKNRRKWKTITLDELRAFFGILILMSVNPRHQLYLYWSSDNFFNAPEISKVMSFKRFQSIMNCLHLSDNTKEKKRGEDGYDRLARVRPLIDALNKRFQKEYTPSAHQAIDESMILFKGRSSLKQYMPMKPIKRGYKVWCRADSETGYLIAFQVYEGKNAKRPANQALGEYVVLSLVEGVGPGTQLYFDNFFTSTRLMEDLAQKGILAVGTVRTNRKDLPDELKMDNKLQKGEYIWRSKGSIVAYQWRDTKNVHALSNFHHPKDTEEVVRKLANGSSVSVQCPKAISDYNTWMGGVDKFDQKRNAYRADRRSKKSWYRIFYFLLDAAIVNAFIQVNAVNPMTYLWFRLVLGRELINGQTFRTTGSRKPFRMNKEGRKNGHKMVGVSDEVRFMGREHNPVKVENRRRCRWCSTRGKEVRTSFLCKACSVPLCVTCFGPFHEVVSQN